MPPRQKLPGGLTEADVARLRGQLDAGRRPRVALSGPQFEQGATGSVVRIGDPAVDGADFLTVRVKVNGVADELAFAPSELNIGTRAAATKSASARSAGTRSAGTRSASTRSAGTRSAGTSAPASKGPAAPAAGPAAPAAGPAAPAAGPAQRPSAPPPAAIRTPAPATPAQAPATPAQVPDPQSQGGGRRRKAPATPAVTVTISSSGAAWSVSASRGARTIAKNVPVTPGAVTAIADLLGQPGLAEAVAEINETARLQAEQRAEQLRAELSDLEAMLATHRAPR